MLQTEAYSLPPPLLGYVSSPQGNATNHNYTRIPAEPARSFKSPRECYKLLNSLGTSSSWFSVSSPQGNATNEHRIRSSERRVIVSSPQGNATNSLLNLLPTSPISLRFKSPRECYKQQTETEQTVEEKKRFQVPKGMLQTDQESSIPKCYRLFQVPKGMLQTLGYCHYGKGVAFSFKSPRECYKLERTGYNKNLVLGFKSPRECYKRTCRAHIGRTAEHQFQVPKGMLQTHRG